MKNDKHVVSSLLAIYHIRKTPPSPNISIHILSKQLRPDSTTSDDSIGDLEAFPEQRARVRGRGTRVLILYLLVA